MVRANGGEEGKGSSGTSPMKIWVFFRKSERGNTCQKNGHYSIDHNQPSPDDQERAKARNPHRGHTSFPFSIHLASFRGRSSKSRHHAQGNREGEGNHETRVLQKSKNVLLVGETRDEKKIVLSQKGIRCVQLRKQKMSGQRGHLENQHH